MVRSVKEWGAWPRRAIILAGCAVASVAQAANTPLDTSSANGTVQVRYDPMMRQTWVTGRAASDLCFSLSLPDEWQRADGGIKAASSDGELSLSLRSARELRDMPQPDLVGRDAAALQQDYEGLLGRPAQSVSLSSKAGAARWSATWIDANLPTASHAITVETLIVPLSGEWVLELSLSGVETREAYNALTQHMLARLKVQGRAACQG
jgi:hypothetical protein